MSVDFNNFKSIIGGLTKLLKIQNVGVANRLPTPLVFTGAPLRAGLSPTKIASRIIARKPEAGLPVGALPSGGVAPDEIMERIRIEEIVKAIQQEMVIQVAIPPGTTLTAAGASPAGPVSVFGSTLTFTTGYGVAQ